MFGNRRSKRATPSVPVLYPEFFKNIHERLVANGGSDTEEEIGFGVGNAIFNTAMSRYERMNDIRRGQTFLERFEDRDPSQQTAADEMIAYLVREDPDNEEWISTLLGRLSDVLSRPA
jgi:hypothetical protein